jgi:hypothetical protein
MSRDDLPAELGEPYPSLALAADHVAPTYLEFEVNCREIAAERQDLEPDPFLFDAWPRRARDAVAVDLLESVAVLAQGA